jgi:hypothetical protein
MSKLQIKTPIYLCGLIVGLIVYLVSNKTPAFGYQSMIRLFCLTKGWSNDLLSKLVGRYKKTYHFSKPNGNFAVISDGEKQEAVKNLRELGFYVFDARLPEDFCNQLLEFATTHCCQARPMDGEEIENKKDIVYPRNMPSAIRYDFKLNDLLENQVLQAILADTSFAALAQEYLGTKPVVDVIALWWHTNFTDKPDKEAAQYFHFDMDRPKWLKFFIYLTDVSKDHGPHTFVAGSHKYNGIPSPLLNQGYSRLKDAEVEYYYEKKNIIEFIAPRGTIIAEDTRGLHKGKHVRIEDRLILQIQYSNSLFGAKYERATFPKNIDVRLKNTISRYPDLFKNFKQPKDSSWL